jgi:D-alanyl-D-alanine carboxypeptidase
MVRILILLIAVIFAAFPAWQADADERPEWVAGTPALVADLDSGRVLYSQNPTLPWYPASLTKLMTAYVAMDEVRNGRVRMDDMFTVSARAAGEPPSKMGFSPGTQIRLDNALLIIMVRSANDVATTIAEGISGSVDDFVAIMNFHAARLGMHDTYFTNAHGLPDARKRTTARDMAILARALYREFPEQRALFGLDSIRYGGSTMRNHNGLIGRYSGTTGMKTGYICSSGFNVVVTAERRGRRLVAIVMGAPSAAERTIKSAGLLEHGFSRLGWGGTTLEALPRQGGIAPPDLRPVTCGRNPPSSITLPQAGGERFAFAGGAASTPLLPEVDLPDRGPANPVRVWTGATPPGASAPVAAPVAAAGAARTGGQAIPLPPPRPF